jgi:molybdopterin/thiamine biosynthesis adenylyltransferase
VAPSDLPRQVLYRPADVGRPKVEVAAERLRELRPGGLEIVTEQRALGETLARRLVPAHDVALDGLDSRAARGLLARVCFEAGRPLVHGAVDGASGRAVLLAPGGPCYRCGRSAVLGPAAGLIGAAQAGMALQWLLGREPGPRPVLVFDLARTGCLELTAATRPDCPLCAGRGVPHPAQ